MNRRKTVSNTTNISANTEQSEKQVAIQLGGKVLLRDYFAAQAMKYMSLPTMVYATGRIGDNTWELKSMDQFPFEDMSKVAYAWADAMIKARNG